MHIEEAEECHSFHTREGVQFSGKWKRKCTAITLSTSDDSSRTSSFSNCRYCIGVLLNSDIIRILSSLSVANVKCTISKSIFFFTFLSFCSSPLWSSPLSEPGRSAITYGILGMQAVAAVAVANYNIQQQMEASVSSPCQCVYQQQTYPNLLSMIPTATWPRSGVNKRNGTVSCYNCGISGQYAQECNMLSRDSTGRHKSFALLKTYVHHWFLLVSFLLLYTTSFDKEILLYLTIC